MKPFETGKRLGAYTVVFSLPFFGQSQSYYRVSNIFGKKFYLSLQEAPEGGCIFPAGLHHEGLLHPVDGGVVEVDGATLSYRVFDFVSGETLDRRLARLGKLRVYEAKSVVRHLLDLLRYLHEQSSGISLDGLSPSGLLLGLQDDSVKLLEVSSFPCPLYRAPECAAGGVPGERSDIYVIGILFYLMLFGKLPWKAAPLSGYNEASMAKLDEERRQPLCFPEGDIFELDNSVEQVLRRALSYDGKDRYPDAACMLDALDARSESSYCLPAVLPHSEQPVQNEKCGRSSQPADPPRGFAAVAGMRELKGYLTTSVINLLRNTKRARRYRIHIPNGMLLYGPPGCGKSFFAEKFAEEVGYSSIHVKASDLASIYVHGTQSKIRELFDEARKKAPTVICFDEFDALAPNRNHPLSAHQYGEVNEFLSQLNNCGQDGIFVIASTNKPDLIDPAVLRRGRIDRVVYLPAPDTEARRELFLLNLRDRPCSASIDVQRLAELTIGYVCSDIAGIVNDAAITAAEKDLPITQQILERSISLTPPSVSKSTLDSYVALKRSMDASCQG